MKYVIAIDDEGFAHSLIGPFTPEDARTFLDKQNDNYQGECQEPFTIMSATAPEDYVTEEWD